MPNGGLDDHGIGSNRSDLGRVRFVLNHASASTAIAVGAVDASDQFAIFSNFGRCVALNAPGVGITSAWFTDDNATQILSGTSMASPHVAGVAALYLEQHPTAVPSLVRSAILSNATPNVLGGVPAGTPNLLVYSRLVAVTMSAPDYADPGPLTATATVSGRPGSYYYQWTYAWCFAGTAPGDCDASSHISQGGCDMTSLQEQVVAKDKYMDFYVDVLTAPGGQVLASDSHHVIGPYTGGL